MTEIRYIQLLSRGLDQVWHPGSDREAIEKREANLWEVQDSVMQEVQSIDTWRMIWFAGREFEGGGGRWSWWMNGGAFMLWEGSYMLRAGGENQNPAEHRPISRVHPPPCHAWMKRPLTSPSVPLIGTHFHTLSFARDLLSICRLLRNPRAPEIVSQLSCPWKEHKIKKEKVIKPDHRWTRRATMLTGQLPSFC